jgi:DNA-binding transcriptional ArsR family regulator
MQRQVAVFKALSSEPRLKIVGFLREHPHCVNALVQRLGMAQSAVSQHLRALKEAGLVLAEKRGAWMHYRIDRENLERHGKALAEIFGVRPAPRKSSGKTGKCPPELRGECRQPKGRSR